VAQERAQDAELDDEVAKEEGARQGTEEYGPPWQRVEVPVGDDGTGSVLIGVYGEDVEATGAPEGVQVEVAPSHASGVTRVTVSGAKPGTAVVYYLAKGAT